MFTGVKYINHSRLHGGAQNTVQCHTIHHKYIQTHPPANGTRATFEPLNVSVCFDILFFMYRSLITLASFLFFICHYRLCYHYVYQRKIRLDGTSQMEFYFKSFYLKTRTYKPSSFIIFFP
jgi:hypothetical protein